MKDFTTGKFFNLILLVIIAGLMFAIRFNYDLCNEQLQTKDKEITDLHKEVNLAKIKNHILEKIVLTDEELATLDMNDDGKVTASDYVLLKNKD
jgi:hypothetical protein